MLRGHLDLGRPVGILHRLARIAPEVRVGQYHASEQLLNSLAHLPRPNPLATESALPVLLEVVLGRELLALRVLEWSAADQDLEESYAERPNVRLACVVREAASALGGEVLCK